MEAGGLVEDVEEGLFLPEAGEPGVRRGLVWPERAEVAGLPAADGLGGSFIAGVWGEAVGESPAADTGAIRLESQAAAQLAGDGTGGGARQGGEQARRRAGEWRAGEWRVARARASGGQSG